jgi:hypothetical protein
VKIERKYMDEQTHETIDRLRREVAELRARMNAIEKSVASLQSLFGKGGEPAYNPADNALNEGDLLQRFARGR